MVIKLANQAARAAPAEKHGGKYGLITRAKSLVLSQPALSTRKR